MGALVEITRFYDPEEAFCAKGYLESRGIETFLQNEHHLTMAPWLRVALDGYGLYTFEKNAADAIAVLTKINANIPEPGNQQNIPDEDYGSRKNWMWFPLAFLTGLPFVLRYRSWLVASLQTLLVLLFLGMVFLMQFR